LSDISQISDWGWHNVESWALCEQGFVICHLFTITSTINIDTNLYGI